MNVAFHLVDVEVRPACIHGRGGNQALKAGAAVGSTAWHGAGGED